SKIGLFLGPLIPEGLTIVEQSFRIEAMARELKLIGTTRFSDGTSRDDPPLTLSLDGKETLLMPGASISCKIIDKRSIDVIGKVNTRMLNYLSVGHVVISAEGKTLTETKTLTQREVVPEGVDPTSGAVIKTGAHVFVFKKMS